MDPLAALPAEIVLHVLEFAPVGSIAALTRTSRSWHAFIDHVHQDAIYAAHLPGISPASTPQEYMGALKSFRPGSISSGVNSWKEACRRRSLLQDAWNSPDPMPIATVIQIGTHPVWRFKPDFDRRLIMSTSQAGGVNVTDMDTGDLLWSLGRNEVRPFAHLEYQNGTAVWVCLPDRLPHSSLFATKVLTRTPHNRTVSATRWRCGRRACPGVRGENSAGSPCYIMTPRREAFSCLMIRYAWSPPRERALCMMSLQRAPKHQCRCGPICK